MRLHPALGTAIACSIALVVCYACFSERTLASEPNPAKSIYAPLQVYIAARIAEFEQINPERKAVLDDLGTYIRSCAEASTPCNLTFICTHNSRRSHMAQAWSAVAAVRFGVPGVTAYSGGTEVSAFNSRAVDAMRRAGFSMEKTTEADNPIYHVRFSDNSPALTCFSKTFDQPPNPRKNFAAVMTCSQADAACPLVPGADARFAIAYEDPKAFDGTAQESRMYDERCAQIAREMLYVFSRVLPGP